MVLLRPASADAGQTTATTQTSNLPPWGGRGGNGTFPQFPGQGRGPPGGFFNGNGNSGPAGYFQGGFGRGFRQGPAANLTVGQTITLTSTSGNYVQVNDTGANGTATGNLTFTISGRLSQGYTLSITAGTITVGGNSYTVSTGSAQTGPSATALEGQGTTSSSGQFLLSGQAHGSFGGSSARIDIDLQVGSTEYIVQLNTSVQS